MQQSSQCSFLGLTAPQGPIIVNGYILNIDNGVLLPFCVHLLHHLLRFQYLFLRHVHGQVWNGGQPSIQYTTKLLSMQYMLTLQRRSARVLEQNCESEATYSRCYPAFYRAATAATHCDLSHDFKLTMALLALTYKISCHLRALLPI